MQILIYLFIGTVSLVVNMALFIGSTRADVPVNYAIAVSFAVAALCNYLLCVAILFRHKARWNTAMEVFWYVFTVLVMGLVDFTVTRFLIALVPFFTLHWSGAKFLAAIIGFAGNFVLRKALVFPGKIRR